MMIWTKAAVISAVMVLGACSNATGWNGDGSVAGAAGAPGSASDPASPAYFQETVGDRVFFAVDESTLSAAAQATLEAQARWLLENSDFTVTIEGHADEQGTREYNIALGARRATAVREFLEQRGIPGARLQTVSFGKERPVEVCSTEACYTKNRRAVTVLASALTG